MRRCSGGVLLEIERARPGRAASRVCEGKPVAPLVVREQKLQRLGRAGFRIRALR
jgi:hypothetical protein